MYRLLELFKGTGSVGKVAEDMGFSVVSLDIDPLSNATITQSILDWDYEDFFNKNNYIPDFIWASPPCNTFSPLAYPLKERDPQTGEPRSARAEEGTAILYKTLKIINFFKSKNPNLLYVVENPRGMMRKDKKIKKLMLNSTLYCLYGDKRRKATDFFSNYDLQLKTGKQCPKETVGVIELPLNERYKIPKKLVKKILERFESVYRKECENCKN